MGESKSGSSSKAGESSSKSSQETPERAQMPQRSHSDPATSGWAQNFGASHASSSSTKARRPSKDSLDETAIGDDDDDDNNDETYEEIYEEAEKEEPTPKITKRHSSSGHVNVYTECGRHGDDWLFGGIADAVKSAFKKNDK